MHALLRIVLVALLGYLVVCVATWLFQRRLQYFPDTFDPPFPPGEAYGALEAVTVRASDGVDVKAWWWPGTRPETLLVFHGNAGHRGHRVGWMEPFHDLGWSILLTDYRGYGGSGGSPTEEGLCLDAQAFLGWLRARGIERVALFGESIGCSVAIDLAAREPVSALVLQSGTISVVGVAKRHYPFLPVGALMKDRFDSADKIRAIHAPLFCLHGADDRIIPAEFGRAIFEAANEPKEWWLVERAGHNDVPWYPGRDYYARIHAFLERTLIPG